jgi:hypothetical protein
VDGYIEAPRNANIGTNVLNLGVVTPTQKAIPAFHEVKSKNGSVFN